MTAVSRPRCHASNGMRIRSSCAATLGHAVLTIPDGRIRCRATSDSFESELRVLGGDATMSAHPRLGRNSLKLLNLRRDIPERSEEHTSELQSRGHLVCRLLLEKKKKLRID